MWSAIHDKVKLLADALPIIEKWRLAEEKIIWTNGCFDLLHLGHVMYLAKARGMGDRLVVGLNSDSSIRRLKGDPRPLTPLSARKLVLASLQAVDLVIPFTSDTPIDEIRTVKPDLLVKGGDYQAKQIVGALEVESWGGSVAVIPMQKGFSTSDLINKIKSL